MPRRRALPAVAIRAGVVLVLALLVLAVARRGLAADDRPAGPAIESRCPNP